jgi:hypothetical protein
MHGYGRISYMVDVDLKNELNLCMPVQKKLNKDGILCCHVIKVMSYIGTVKRIPDNYILPQWSLAPPDNHSQSQLLKYRGKTCVMHYGNLCTDFAKHVVVLGFRQD